MHQNSDLRRDRLDDLKMTETEEPAQTNPQQGMSRRHHIHNQASATRDACGANTEQTQRLENHSLELQNTPMYKTRDNLTQIVAYLILVSQNVISRGSFIIHTHTVKY